MAAERPMATDEQIQELERKVAALQEAVQAESIILALRLRAQKLRCGGRAATPGTAQAVREILADELDALADEIERIGR